VKTALATPRLPLQALRAQHSAAAQRTTSTQRTEMTLKKFNAFNELNVHYSLLEVVLVDAMIKSILMRLMINAELYTVVQKPDPYESFK